MIKVSLNGGQGATAVLKTKARPAIAEKRIEGAILKTKLETGIRPNNVDK